jgi:hypothetical protein
MANSGVSPLITVPPTGYRVVTQSSDTIMISSTGGELGWSRPSIP